MRLSSGPCQYPHALLDRTDGPWLWLGEGCILLGSVKSRMRRILAVLCIFLMVSPAFAGRRASSSGSTRRTTSASASSHSHRSTIRCSGCARTASGKIARSGRAVHSFRQGNPCPATGRTRGACAGYAVDHLTPLYRGGSDTSDNMQWLGTTEHKAKHRSLK